MLILLLGTLSAMSMLLCGRLRVFPDYHKYMKYPFISYLILTPMYHAVYFFSVGLSSWISIFPTVTLLVFITGLILRKTTPRNPELEPAFHSWLVGSLENIAVGITLLFCSAPHVILHVA